VEIIKDCMKNDWNFVLKHIIHEDNAFVNTLAKMRANYTNPLIMINKKISLPLTLLARNRLCLRWVSILVNNIDEIYTM